MELETLLPLYLQCSTEAEGLMMPKETSAEGEHSKQSLRGWPLATAVLAFIAYAALVCVMLLSRDATEVVWSRLTFIFASVQAISFAAVGALWGTTVQKQRADKAEARADKLERQASNGRALAAAIIADDRVQEGAGAADRTSRGIGAASGVEQAVRRHALLARELFGEKSE